MKLKNDSKQPIPNVDRIMDSTHLKYLNTPLILPVLTRALLAAFFRSNAAKFLS